VTREVVVRKLKFDGAVRYEWEGDLLEELPGWSVVLHDSRRHQKRQTDSPAPDNEGGFGFHYLGTNGPLTVLFWFDLRGRFVDAKCDAALPATLDGDRIDFVDLDLDVVVLPGFTHYVRDQEAFAERSVSMGYTEEAKRVAHQGILHALRMVRRRQYPFDGDPERLLRQVLSGTPPGE
jgi:hypothetical protein